MNTFRKTCFLVFSLVMFCGLTTSVKAADYIRQAGAIYYKGVLLPMADERSFVELGFGYAKDWRYVYWEGRVLPYVDPMGFRLLPPGRTGTILPRPDDEPWYPQSIEGYKVINNKVFFNGKQVDATASNFTELGGGYAKDAFSVFFMGRKLTDASPSSFVHVGGGYYKDAWNVFFDGRKVPDVSVSSFKYDGNGYAHDAFQVYHYGRKISPDR